MTDPTGTIRIGRSTAAGGPTDLVASMADDATDIGIVAYQAPARLALVTYAPTPPGVHGAEATGAALQQALLSYQWMCDTADAESDVQAAYLEMCAAVGQFSYPVTTQINGAPAEVWAADMGSVTPPERTFIDLSRPDVLAFTVSIPVYPIPGAP